MREETLLTLIDKVYAAAESPDQWPEFLDVLSAALGSEKTVLLYHNIGLESASVAAAVRIDPECVRQYTDYYGARNVFFALDDNLSPGNVFDETSVDSSRLRASEYYNDFLIPWDAPHALGVTLRNDAEVIAVVSTMRPARKAPFGSDEACLLRHLAPHVVRAFKLHERLTQREGRTSLALAALESVPQPILVVDANGCILLTNQQGAAVLRGGPLVSDRGTLRVSPAAIDIQLRQRIRQATGGGMSSVGRCGELSLFDAGGRIACTLFITPIAARLNDTVHPLAAVIVEMAQARRDGLVSSLRPRFGFTQAETRVAALLLEGRSVAEAADDLAVTRHTIRTHLKSMYRKTDTRRQGQLVSMLSRAAARPA